MMGRGCGARTAAILLFLATGWILGLTACTPPPAQKKPDNSGIIGRTTQEVGEYDPAAGGRVSDSSIDEGQLATPLIGAAAAYGPLTEQAAKLAIQQRLNFFYAEYGRYPRDHAEFMARIIQPDSPEAVHLPALRAGRKYQYDVENHELLIVRDGDGAAGSGGH